MLLEFFAEKLLTKFAHVFTSLQGQLKEALCQNVKELFRVHYQIQFVLCKFHFKNCIKSYTEKLRPQGGGCEVQDT